MHSRSRLMQVQVEIAHLQTKNRFLESSFETFSTWYLRFIDRSFPAGTRDAFNNGENHPIAVGATVRILLPPRDHQGHAEPLSVPQESPPASLEKHEPPAHVKHVSLPHILFPRFILTHDNHCSPRKMIESRTLTKTQFWRHSSSKRGDY